jgi:hypothetical protein
MSNFKKLVHARMAKTGESWQTASRHVRSEAAGPLTVTPELVRVGSDAGQPPSPLDLASNPYDIAVVEPFGVRELRHTQNRTTGKVERVGLYMGETPSNERLLDLARVAKTTWSDVEISIIGLPQADGYSYELWATDWTRRWARFGKSLADHYGVPPEALAGL